MGMDFNMAFAILNIKMTKDESLIRSAYRMALPANHPEDNPEGFKLLREAYEKALEYSHILAYVSEQEDNTPIGALQKKIEGIYQSISARIRCESWKELLREDVFDDLDYYEEAKWELFTFLQQNYRVPREIYQLLDERFEICKYAQEFKEKLSDTFVDYMISNVTNENYGFSYEWFRMLEGKDDADYDTFLSYVQELEGAIQIEDLTRAGNLIRTIDAMGIRYPYYTLDKADYFIATGENEEAKAIALELADVETYWNNVHIQMRCGEVLWRVGEKEKAYVSLCQSLALSHENYIGNKYAALYEMEHGELKKALQHIYVNRIFRDDEELYEAANQLEQELIALCEQNTEPMESEDARLLAYAYRYQGELDKAIAVITSEDSYEKEIKDYHMFLFELYQQKQDYPMALKHGKRRLECIQEKLAVLETGAPTSVDETKESLMHNLSDSNLQLGLVLMSYAKNERVKLFQEAIPFLIAAWEAEPENIVAQMNLAHCYLEIREFQKTYEVYDALISRLGEQSGLLLLKQKLCYEMGRLQEVVVLYYQMLNQGAQDAGIYEYAARAYLDAGQFDHADIILAKADVDGVESYGLRALNLICCFLSRQTYNGFAFDLNQELDEMLQEGEQDAQNLNTKDYLAELYYIKALSAAQFQENKRRHLLSAIEVNDREKYHNTLAELYVQSGKPQEALKEYVYIEEYFTPDTDLYIEMAERYFDVDDIAHAREYVQKVIDLDPENENVYRTAAMIYDDFGSSRGIFYHDSIRLWKQYIALNPEEIAFAYVRCGMAHLYLGQYQEALFFFTELEKTAQWDRKCDICVMFGRAYNGLGRYEEAASYIEQGLVMMKEKDKTEEFAYQAVLALGHIYMRLGKLDAADKTIRDYMEYYYTLEKKAYAVMTLKDMYVSAGLYEKADKLLKIYTYANRMIDEGFYLYMTLSARRRFCTTFWEKIVLLREVKRALREYDRHDLRRLYADILGYDFLMVRKAIIVKQKLPQVMTWDLYRNDLLDLIRMHKFLRQESEVARYNKIVLGVMQREFGCGDLDLYDNFIDSSRERRLDALTYLVQLLSLTGEVALAEKYAAMMGACALCTDCNEIICYDRFEAFGVFYEAKGDVQRAYEYYEKAVRSHGYYKGYAMLCMKKKYGKK